MRQLLVGGDVSPWHRRAAGFWGSAIHSAWRACAGDLTALHDATGTAVTAHTAPASPEHPAVPCFRDLGDTARCHSIPRAGCPHAGDLGDTTRRCTGDLRDTTRCHSIPRAGSSHTGDLRDTTHCCIGDLGDAAHHHGNPQSRMSPNRGPQ